MWKYALVLALLTGGFANAAPERPATTIPTAEELVALERARDKRPRDEERRDELGVAYYRFARAALDRSEGIGNTSALSMSAQSTDVRFSPK